MTGLRSRRRRRADAEAPRLSADSVKLTAADFAIMRCLQDDPRRPVASIAQELGTPESTVRHRLNRLVRHRIVEFSAVTDPFRLGYRIWALIEIQV